MVSNPLYLGACEGMGFPNLPVPGSGGGSGDGLKIAAGDAIKISRITISDISYSRIGVNTDDETITVDSVTNKLKSLCIGLKDLSTSEVNTGIKDTDGKHIYKRSFDFLFTSGSIVEVGTIDNVYKVKSIIGMAYESSYSFVLPRIISASDLLEVFFEPATGKVKANAAGSHTGTTGFVTIFYTKSA